MMLSEAFIDRWLATSIEDGSPPKLNGLPTGTGSFKIETYSKELSPSGAPSFFNRQLKIIIQI